MYIMRLHRVPTLRGRLEYIFVIHSLAKKRGVSIPPSKYLGSRIAGYAGRGGVPRGVLFGWHINREAPDTPKHHATHETHANHAIACNGPPTGCRRHRDFLREEKLKARRRRLGCCNRK